MELVHAFFYLGKLDLYLLYYFGDGDQFVSRSDHSVQAFFASAIFVCFIQIDNFVVSMNGTIIHPLIAATQTAEVVIILSR